MLSIKYKYPPSSIIVMAKTSVWNDMVSNTTIDKSVAKSVCLKTNVFVSYAYLLKHMEPN